MEEISQHIDSEIPKVDLANLCTFLDLIKILFGIRGGILTTL